MCKSRVGCSNIAMHEWDGASEKVGYHLIVRYFLITNIEGIYAEVCDSSPRLCAA